MTPRSAALLLCIAVGAALIAGPAPAPAHAGEPGGGKADYARAAKLARDVRGKVRNERLNPTWVGPDRVVFSVRQDDGTWEWRIAGPGGANAAFDHAKVASGLSAVLPERVVAGRIALRVLAFEDGDLLVESGARLFAIDPGRAAVSELDPADVDSLRLGVTRRRRSRNLGGDTSLFFVNGGDAPVELVWLDTGGGERRYATVAPGASHSQHTLVGHVWLVRTTDGTEMGRYEGGRKPGVVFIGKEPAEAPKPPPRRDPALSPDGKLRIVIQEHDVVLRNVRTKADQALTTDGEPDDRYVNRVHWSPDGRFVAVQRERPAQRRTVHIVESSPKDQFQPKLQSFDYLKPGDRIAHRRPHVFDVKAGKRLEIDESLFANPWSVGRESWSAEGNRFRFLYNQRGHQALRLIEIDAEGARRSKDAVRALIDETSETFVDYSQKTYLRELADGDWLWASERSGWNHLYRVDGKSGEATPLTQGDWCVREVVHVDEQAGTLTFRAMGVHPEQDPYHVHVGWLPLAGGDITWLTDGDGTHAVDFSPDRSHYVATYSRADLAPVHELRRTHDGRELAELARADWAPLLETGWKPPVRFSAKGRDGETDIWGLLHLPTRSFGRKSLPVVEAIYAGPHDHHVPKSFRAWSGARAMAEHGFAVVQIDGMGTNWRSKAFHDVCWQNIGDAGLPDRIAWIRALAKEHPSLDLDRVGIYGGSAGGQNALRALLAHGDFYDVAVADCGCHDNRMDKIWWNEAWMGWPIGPHYEEQSNVTQAHKLTGKLLLIVGELDRNVDPASTMQVVDALIKADKDFDLLVMPGVGHGAAGTSYGRRRQRDFLVRHLWGVEPRWE